MIPRHVKLRGFLCYKGEQAIDFDSNASLWMLSGLNGSGKSSIFDAITYALFGHHRGGGQHSHELINKDSDGLLVEFDFLLDGKTYRAKRTLKRKAAGGAAGTQQIFRADANGTGAGGWTPLEGTGQKREFDAWVADNIGLTYETFTSSVLLLQGKAEKLLDSKPEGRREVLAGIVDLQRYEALHKKADEGRKELDTTLKRLDLQLKTLPKVTPLDMAIADEHIAAKEVERTAARGEVERLQDLQRQSRSWLDVREQLQKASRRHRDAEQLLGDASAIEKAVERLRDLRDVLPRLHEVVEHRNSAHKAKREIAELAKKHEEAKDQFSRHESALKQSGDKKASLQRLIDSDVTRQGRLAQEFRASAVVMTRLAECEKNEADLKDLLAELQKLPADPVALAQEARARLDATARIAEVVPVLKRFADARDELRKAVHLERTATEAQNQVKANGQKLADEVEQLKPQLAEAERSLKEARDQTADSGALLRQAKASLEELSDLEGAKACSHCGQALTPRHVEDERRRRSATVEKREAKAQAAQAAQEAASVAEKLLRTRFDAAHHNLQEARVKYSEYKKDLERAQGDAIRLRGECGQAVAELPDEYRKRVGPRPEEGWTATTFPTPEQLTGLRVQAGRVKEVRKELDKSEAVLQQWHAVQAREAAFRLTLERLQAELPADRAALRQQHAGLQAEESSLDKGLTANRQALRDAEREEVRLRTERDKSHEQLGKLTTQIDKQALIEEQAKQGIARVLKLLPAPWHAQAQTAGMRDLNELGSERTELERTQTDERGKQLQQARAGLDGIRDEVAKLAEQEQAFPADARLDPATLQTNLAAAKQAESGCDRALTEAAKQRALLESHRQQRHTLEEEYLETESEHVTQKLLADLLGRDRLQLYLVRQAERQVVEYANAVLDRLSGGQLYLKLSGEANGEGSTGKALDLEAYNRSTGEKPINVAFLSGSQKFRVAVSLALGIGQYASRQHRPIESVIIDEGFGCLDSQGRQVMIQELQNLRGQMRCILLVSHQEDFAEAFADGYHFELESGATRVTRFHR